MYDHYYLDYPEYPKMPKHKMVSTCEIITFNVMFKVGFRKI